MSKFGMVTSHNYKFCRHRDFSIINFKLVGGTVQDLEVMPELSGT